ncbi:hypothetical protein [Streptomyces sp. DSM 41634]|uniref:hypothetical protein n=1 Tax=Streptomyces sp. DSM 41634 TaxID=3448656 RepID=UPI0028835E03|nr:hypothetical protein [Streptomyces sp. DSM 41633]
MIAASERRAQLVVSGESTVDVLAWSSQAAHQLSPPASLTRTLHTTGREQGAPQVHSPRAEAVPNLWLSADHVHFSRSSMVDIEAEVRTTSPPNELIRRAVNGQ